MTEKTLTALRKLWRGLPRGKLAGSPIGGHTRRTDRRNIRELVELRVGDRTTNVYTLDIGPDSMMVLVRTSIRDGSVVQARLSEHDGQFCQARVVHCTQAVNGFKVGLVFEKEGEPARNALRLRKTRIIR